MSFNRSREWIVLLAILLVAVFFRLYRLDQLPPGLHYDEAFKAVEARKVIAGIERPIFFRENLTEEPMMVYATALAFVLFGDSPFSVRLVSAAAGVGTVAALYWLARSLFAEWSDKGAQGGVMDRASGWGYRAGPALAALVLGVLYWHVNFSRLGMEPILLPLMLTLGLAFLWSGLRGRRMVHFALAGGFLGGTQYTYKAALFVPFLLALWIAGEILLERGFWRRTRNGLAVMAFSAVLVFAPLGIYFVQHPAEFIERPATVTVAPSQVATLAENAVRVAGMFFVQGDENPRSNLPGRPVLDPFLAVGFIVGLIACGLRIRRSEARLMLLWVGVMVAPTVLTDFAPHFGRSIGATPVVALLTAVGLAELVTRIRLPRVVLIAALALGLATSSVLTLRDYIQTWGTRTGLYDSFDVGLLKLAERLQARPVGQTVYLSPVDQDYYTIQYGLNSRTARSFDGRRVLVIAPPGQSAAYGVVTREDSRTLAQLTRVFPSGRVVEQWQDYAGRPYGAIFLGEGDRRIAPSQAVGARLGDAVELVGYDVIQEQNAVVVTLYWKCRRETSADDTVFVHLIGPPNPETQTTIWAQVDAQPGRGSYPTGKWKTNETIIEEYRLEVPPGAPQAAYRLEVGMYDLKTGARLVVTDARGTRLENDRVLFEGVTIP